MERRIDFFRVRRMLCGGCGRRWTVDLEWIKQWEQGLEACPGCGMTCEHIDSPRVTVDPADPALDDDQLARFVWYHTSTQPDWPKRDFDPAAELTTEIRTMMGGDRRVAAWAARQRAKALHVGTYEAAIHNMLRRIGDQADRGNLFYLYRVHLKPSVVAQSGWEVDPSNFVGDVDLNEICPPGVDVARYLNYHEDPGGLSLALGRGAIESVQQVVVPPLDTWDEGWVRDSVAALVDASESDPVVGATGRLARLLPPTPPQVLAARELAMAVAVRLPANLQDQFMAAAAFADGADPKLWARYASGLLALVEDPHRVFAALDGSVKRIV